MVKLDISETWNNDHDATFRESDQEDENGELLANGNAPYFVHSNGNYMIIGHAERLGASKNFGDGY